VHGASAQENKWLSENPATVVQQPFMFHYRLYGLVSVCLVRHARKKFGKKLKLPETLSGPRARLKYPETSPQTSEKANRMAQGQSRRADLVAYRVRP
jgi:hypothetical protein